MRNEKGCSNFMKRGISMLAAFLLVVCAARAVDVPMELAPEVRGYFKKDPLLFQGNPRMFDDVVLVVGKAMWDPDRSERSRHAARVAARVELAKFLEGYSTESETNRIQTLEERDGRARSIRLSQEEIRTKLRANQSRVRFFGEWVSKDGATINAAAGIVYGKLPTPLEEADLKKFQCEEPWGRTVRCSRTLQNGGALLAANEKNEVFLLASAEAKRSLPLSARDSVIRSRALARASAFVNGMNVEENAASVLKVVEETDETMGELVADCEFRRLQREWTECVARMRRIGSWVSENEEEEHQVFLLNLSDIWK